MYIHILVGAARRAAPRFIHRPVRFRTTWSEKNTIFFRASRYHHELELDESFPILVQSLNLDEFERGSLVFKVYMFWRQNHHKIILKYRAII